MRGGAEPSNRKADLPELVKETVGTLPENGSVEPCRPLRDDGRCFLVRAITAAAGRGWLPAEKQSATTNNARAVVTDWISCRKGWVVAGLLAAVTAVAGCSHRGQDAEQGVLPPVNTPGPDYLIGPGDNLQVFVWRNPELTATVPVRPDGRISVPLVEDMPAVGKTPTALARDLEGVLKQYVQEPIVNVIVTGFVGPFAQQVRVVGEAAKPQAIPYRANMSVLDVMIDVGGLTKFASGNRAIIVRKVDGKDSEQRVRLDDLLKDGDVGANVKMLPGDILIVPQSYF
jgi:polysaccharide biosynthesis/export protein